MLPSIWLLKPKPVLALFHTTANTDGFLTSVCVPKVDFSQIPLPTHISPFIRLLPLFPSPDTDYSNTPSQNFKAKAGLLKWICKYTCSQKQSRHKTSLTGVNKTGVKTRPEGLMGAAQPSTYSRHYSTPPQNLYSDRLGFLPFHTVCKKVWIKWHYYSTSSGQLN